MLLPQDKYQRAVDEPRKPQKLQKKCDGGVQREKSDDEPAGKADGFLEITLSKH